MRFLTRLGMMLLWNSSPSSARNQRQFPRCKRIVQDSHRLGKIAGGNILSLYSSEPLPKIGGRNALAVKRMMHLSISGVEVA